MFRDAVSLPLDLVNTSTPCRSRSRLLSYSLLGHVPSRKVRWTVAWNSECSFEGRSDPPQFLGSVFELFWQYSLTTHLQSNCILFGSRCFCSKDILFLTIAFLGERID